jgi:hypothetical protein
LTFYKNDVFSYLKGEVHMIEIKKLGEEDAESVSHMIEGIYLEGNCYEFALGVHQDTGFPLAGLVNNGTVWHAGVRHSDGRFFDARGFVEESDIEVPFRKQGPFEIREITIQEMQASRQISEEGALHASQMVQVVYPDFPWNECSLISKTRAFLDELEELCRLHGFMIRAPYVTTQPIVELAHGDEKGFSMSPVMSGGGYLFDRIL